MQVAPYFAPAYFSPFYFAPMAVEPTQAEAVDSDLVAYLAILDRLRETEAFGSVAFAGPSGRTPQGSASMPIAMVLCEGWDEDDEFDPPGPLRRVSFAIEIVVREDDPLGGFRRLKGLEAIARRALDRSDLGGVCLPSLTRLRRARYDPRPLHPEQMVRLEGEFTYPLMPN